VHLYKPPKKISAPLLFISLILLNAPGCTTAQPPQIVAISNPPALKPKTPGEIKSLEQAMATIITVTGNELNLPVVQPLYLHLYQDSDSFGAYAGGYGRRLPFGIVQFAVAVAEENRFHINLERTKGQSWGAQLRTLAHEYGHNIHSVWTVQTAPQWIREGFADWVAAKVLDSLGWQDYALSLHRARLEVSALKVSLPSFSELEDSPKWTVWANQAQGGILTYRLAFLAVSRLMEKQGVAGIAQYFKSQNFQSSFGVSLRDFETEFRQSLAGAKPGSQADIKADKPVWQIGDQWGYVVKSAGVKNPFTREIIKEDVSEGVSLYVMRAGRNEHSYTKDSLALSLTMSGGKIVSKRTPPYQFLFWPLEPGKEWKNSYVLENPERSSSQRYDLRVIVAGIENVAVQAGSFDAFRIEIYNVQSGSLVEELWYSPQTKWFVKARLYQNDGVSEEELTGFKTN
jgi:hypothetical protein